MNNVETSQIGNILTITIDLSKPGEKSGSGKSMVIASTHGNVVVATHNGVPVTLGLNCYIKNQR